MASNGSAASSATGSSTGRPIDPVSRNALRYSLSATEYKLLHQYLLSRSAAVKKKTPAPARYERVVTGKDDYNADAIRLAVRAWAATYLGMKVYDALLDKLASARGQPVAIKAKTHFMKSDNARLAHSVSLIILFNRLIYRFLLRLRTSLTSDQAKPFRERNPRTSSLLTARLTPVIGASMAGLFLGITPKSQLRVTITIYALSRSLEFFYNNLEDLGYFKNRPKWFGSWMLMPPVFGQLLHAFVFDRDCFPAGFGKFILGYSDTYVKVKPEGFTGTVAWPGVYSIVDNLAQIARLKWPVFVSPMLFPNKNPLPTSILAMSPIISSANPSIKHLSCALLHPEDTSCLRTYFTFYLRSFPRIARFFTIYLGAMAVLFKSGALRKDTVPTLNRLAKSILRMSLFVTGAIGTSWGSICFFQNYFPRSMLPTQRFFLGGFLGGCFAFLERRSGRANFLTCTRYSMDSTWKVGVKHGWWKGINNGDVILFTLSLALTQACYEADPKAISSGVFRKGLGLLRGDGWVDRAVVPAPRKADEAVLEERQIKDDGMPIDEEYLREKEKEL